MSTTTKQPRTKETTLEDFRELTTYLASGCRPWIGRDFRQDMEGREIVCTPYAGNYGPAGWLIVVNGSPPRCTIILEHGSERAVSLTHARGKRLGLEQSKIVRRFVSTWLVQLQEAVTIAGKESGA